MSSDNPQLLSVPTYQHPFELQMNQVALLVIDLQNDFCHPDGYLGSQWNIDLSAIRAIIPRVQQVIAWARQHKLPIIYLRESHHPDLSDLTSSQKLRYENSGCPVGAQGKLGGFLIRGDKSADLIDELQVLDGERVIDKPTHSAFIGTDLELILRSQGITQLLIAGVTTECCVLATYLHANNLGFYSLLLEDCCAATNPLDHKAALNVLLAENGAIGWVTSSELLFSAIS
jgi:biuret amidohydrolase